MLEAIPDVTVGLRLARARGAEVPRFPASRMGARAVGLGTDAAVEALARGGRSGLAQILARVIMKPDVQSSGPALKEK